MTGLDTVSALRALGRKDLVIGVTGWCTISSSTSDVITQYSQGNALSSDQQEYQDLGADR